MAGESQPKRDPVCGSFYSSVIWGDLKTAGELLASCPGLVFTRYGHGETPLHLAAQWGQVKVVELLLANNAEANARTEDGDTPLHCAAENGECEVAALLLTGRAEIESTDVWGQTPLHRAAQNGEKDMVELLLARGAEVNAKDKLDQTPLRLAASWEPEVTVLLQRHGGHI